MSMMRIESLGNGYVARKIIERSKDTDIIYLTDDVILNTHAVKELANTLENSISKDKIKEKIEEIRHAEFMKLQLGYKHDIESVAQVEVLQELLKGE